MSLVINSTAANGAHARITLDKTGSDKGTVKVETWDPGQDVNGPPSKTETQKLSSIRAKADGSMIECKVSVFLISVTVTISIHDAQPPKPPFVNVTAPGHDDNYPITEADKTKVKQFLVGCHFPPITP